VEVDIADGAVTNAKIAANAAIADSKLATISSAGKVANSATTATSANTNNAIVARDASGNFNAGNITASSFVRSGGTAAQILAANGTVITAGTGISISGGTISANLSNTTDSSIYSTKAYRQKGVDSVNALINTKQNTLTAGDGISISGNTISSFNSVRLGSFSTLLSSNITVAINNTNFSTLVTNTGLLNQQMSIINVTNNGGDITITMPPTSSNEGKRVIIRNINDNKIVTVNAFNTSSSIDNFRSLGGVRLVEYICVGSTWVLINRL